MGLETDGKEKLKELPEQVTRKVCTSKVRIVYQEQITGARGGGGKGRGAYRVLAEERAKK